MKEAINATIQRILRTDRGITANQVLVDDLGFDSLKLFQLITELEDEFDIAISFRDAQNISQRCASSPTALTSRVLSARRWVTRKQKSSADPVTRWAASDGPQDQVSPLGPRSSTRNGSAGGVRLLTMNA